MQVWAAAWCGWQDKLVLSAVTPCPAHPSPPTPSPANCQVAGGTWAYSLLLSSSQMARFAAPLCFNFLHVIRMNDLSKGQQVRGLMHASISSSAAC